MGICDPPAVDHTIDAMSPEGWMTVSQAAAYKGVPDYVIRNAIRADAFPVDRESGVLLIQRADLDKWEPNKRGRPRLKKRGRPKKSI